MGELPVACALDPAAREARRSGLLSDLVRQAGTREAREDGLCLTFVAAADVLSLITRVIEAERRCCRFLTFRLIVTADEGPMSLELSGPPGTREFLTALLPEDDGHQDGGAG